MSPRNAIESSLRAAATVAGFALLAIGCRSTPALEVRRLPLHVAVIPITNPTIGQVTPGEFEGEETELRLELDAMAITRVVTDALEDYCFARTTLLELLTVLPAATLLPLAGEESCGWSWPGSKRL